MFKLVGKKWKEVEIEGKGRTKHKKNLGWILATKRQKVKKQSGSTCFQG